MKHPKLVEWEKKFRQACRTVDGYLEKKYGDKYRLHPSRPKHGTTANREYDGLFNVGGTFSAGFGSEHGRGYILKITFATLEKVPSQIKKQIEDDAAQRLREELEKTFPNRNLTVERDGSVYKIFGDLSLGNV